MLLVVVAVTVVVNHVIQSNCLVGAGSHGHGQKECGKRGQNKSAEKESRKRVQKQRAEKEGRKRGQKKEGRTKKVCFEATICWITTERL